MNICKHLINRVIEKMVHPGKKATNKIKSDKEIDSNTEYIAKKGSTTIKLDK